MHKNTTKTELATYLHASCFSPVPSTFITAIKNGNFLSWPGLTTSLISKMPPSVNTAKGHLNQERSGLQSTKSPATDDDFNPKQEIHNVRTNCYMAKIQKFTPSDKAYSNLMGRFPVQSSRGNNYVMVIYSYDANAILAEPLKNRSAGEIVKAWKTINEKLEKAGVSPLVYILDNEISKEFKNALHKKHIKYQLVPPHIHRANAAKRAIQTYKNHFLAGLSSCNPKFPLREWDRLITQAEIILNLLRNSRMNPKLSAYAYLFGPYDFNRYPLAPPGTKVVVHAKPSDRTSWGFHGRDGWTIGPSLEHYRCIKSYIPATKSEINCDTLAFSPHDIPMPKVSTEDFLKQATQDIISFLTHPVASLPSYTKICRKDTIDTAYIDVHNLLATTTDVYVFIQLIIAQVHPRLTLKMINMVDIPKYSSFEDLFHYARKVTVYIDNHAFKNRTFSNKEATHIVLSHLDKPRYAGATKHCESVILHPSIIDDIYLVPEIAGTIDQLKPS